MHTKVLEILEYFKILDRLVAYADFSASADLARQLRPTSDLEEALRRQAMTREARYVMSLDTDVSFQNAQDIRPALGLARRDGVLEPEDFLGIRQTLIVSRKVRRVLENLQGDVPHLFEFAESLPIGLGLVDLISQTISDRGDVVDSASDALSDIRRDMKITYERMMSRLQRYISDPVSYTHLTLPTN